MQDAEDVRPGGHRMVAVLGAKGGCGTTLVAASLAAELAVRQAVCALDLDFGKGDLAGCIDLWPARTIHDLLLEPQRLDADVIRGTAVTHKGGFSVLAQPHDLSKVILPSAEDIRPVLNLARQSWTVVITDCGARADEVALAAALAADEVLLLTTPMVSALRDAGRKIELLQRLELPKHRIRLVVNMRGKGGVSLAAIEEQLGLPVLAELPLDPEAAGAVDFSGRLLRDQVPTSALARAMAGLWGRLDGESAPDTSARPWWKPW
jgi:pilus assembly protein CpaE